MTWRILAGLLGGVGLFLLGMRMMTDGLKLAAGTALRDMLGRWTNSTRRGIASGALVTGLVQSSSAVTVATIGFVNAGVLSLAQGIGVVYGSNIGTTATGWLVALIGFEFNIKAFSLPLIGAGMLVRLFRGDGRAGRLAEVAAGFGLLFLGIDILKSSFGGLAEAVDLDSLTVGGVAGVFLFLGIGVALTFLMQSSSAAIAITLTAVGTGAVTVTGGAALVIGANIGTTSTAALSVIGATPNAKRVALAHMIFNVLTGAVALSTLPFLIGGIDALRSAAGLASNPPAVIAMFHTTFNVLGVAIMTPLTPRLVTFLEGRFRTLEEVESRPRHLDQNVLASPFLALRALALELQRAAGHARAMATEAMDGRLSPRSYEAGRAIVDRLLEASGEFSNRMRQGNLPEPVAAAMPSALRAAGYISEITEMSESLHRAEVGPILASLDLKADYDEYAERVRAVVEEGLGSALEPGAPPPEKRKIGRRYEALKVVILRRAVEKGLPIRSVLGTIDHIQELRVLGNRARKCALFLTPLLSLDGAPPPAEPAEAGA